MTIEAPVGRGGGGLRRAFGWLLWGAGMATFWAGSSALFVQGTFMDSQSVLHIPPWDHEAIGFTKAELLDFATIAAPAGAVVFLLGLLLKR